MTAVTQGGRDRRIDRAHWLAMHPDAAALESVRSALELLTSQVVAIADRHRDQPDDALTVQLDELERALIGADRRLERTIRNLG